MQDTGPEPGAERIAPLGRRLSLLEGVKVVDMTRFLAGPFGSMILADLGATVIKVEQITGDSTRNNPPYYLHGDSAYFLAANRNKQSIAVDIKSASGQEVLRRLIAEADVLLDNLRARQRSALHLSFDEVKKINPRIVSCSITGFGSTGPYSDRPAYDLIVEALSGVMSLTGPVGGPSVRAGVPIGDIAASLYAAIGTLAGLESCRVTGQGVHIDVGMLDCQISLLSYLSQYYFTGGLVASHQGRAHLANPTYDTFQTADGAEIVIAANTQEMWESLCRVIGLDALITDQRFDTNAMRLKNKPELTQILQAEIGERECDWLYRALVDAEVPAAPIKPIDAALADDQVWHREMVVRVPHRVGGDFNTVASPIKADRPGEPFGSPPGLGGHTREILRRLGYSDGDVENLLAQGAVKAAP